MDNKKTSKCGKYLDDLVHSDFNPNLILMMILKDVLNKMALAFNCI